MGVTNTAIFTLRRNLWKITDNGHNKTFYTFAAKASPWPNDNAPPVVENSVRELETVIPSEIIFGKVVPDDYVSLMVNRYNWTSETVYTPYDDADPTLYSKQFYVMTLESGAYHVFKCLNNNNGIPSTSQPLLVETAADDVYYSTADGYQWKYLYSFNSVYYNRFATADYIPVVANSAVTGNAIPGAIETYKIESPGGNYNSVTNGYFTDIAVGGNSQFFGIQGPDTTVLTVSPNTYTVGETITQVYNGVTANGLVVSETTANASASVLTLRNVNNIFVPTLNTITGSTSGKISTVFDVVSPGVSSNNNFYNGCSIYIISGTGAGQINQIAEYLVIGNARRVLLSNTFTTLPDLTSKYVISPRVYIEGDGTGASAISIIDPATKQLQDIRVISPGSGYSYANVSIFGNTGSTAIASNNATVRAIMSPRGGHGADVTSELNAEFLCYSATFANTENGKIPGTGSQYRRVGLVVNPQYSNVLINYTYSSQPTFTVGTTVVGSNSGASGIVSAFYLSNSTIKLSNTVGIFSSSDRLTSTFANGSVNVSSSSNAVVNAVTGNPTVFDNRTLLVCPTATQTGGTLSIGDKVVQFEGGVNLAYGYIQDLQTSGSNTYIYLTEVKGYFQSSDIPTNTYKYIYNDATRQIRIEVDDIVRSDITPYTGDIMYYENIEPVTRNNAQSETVKIIYGFN
jgi:hypothetical protein